jgi:energy-coupling factor transport system ATP-binding protein
MVGNIQFQDVGFSYSKGTPFEHEALHDVNLTIKENKYTAIIGHTGSGKSTLVQHLNALLKPSTGIVRMGDFEITATSENKNLKELRRHVGTVFQFPESQLFEESIGKDIAFGPQNYGKTEEEAWEIAQEALVTVGLDESFMDISPFDLSGGQQRRVAIAGVLALQPQVLVLDEPTAGLDPEGQKEMMDMFYRLKEEQGITVILVTHKMEDVAKYADDVVVLEGGTVIRQTTPKEIFEEVEWLQSKQLDVPVVIDFARKIEQRLGWTFDSIPLTTDELAENIADQFRKTKGKGGLDE